MTTRALRNYLLLPLAITVCASLSHAQTGTTTRIQWTDKSIVYTGNWYTNGSSLNSGGSSALTNAPGATAVVTFTGTGITWIGVLDPWAGVATAYLDGTMNTVDTYGPTTLYQQALFKVSGLANGPHTLSIYVPHVRDANGQGSWVWINAFDIENGSALTGGVTASAGRTEQNSAALTYTGVWFTNASAANSGGSAVLATNSGSRATITFNGTGITWIAYRDQYSGIAMVYVDGVLTATVDTYLSPAQAQAAAYVVNGLASGTHTLTIQVTGTHSPGSGGSWVWVDAFDVVSGASSLPQGKTATQSSTYPGYAGAGAASAIDGNPDGSFLDGSVTATNLDANAWWQVDYGVSTPAGTIVIWNRTDCCGSRLNDYWVFVSDTPFLPTDTPATLQNRAGTWSSHQTTAPNPSTTIAAGAQGRYLRVQLTGTNYLSLAEVQVFPGAPPSDLAQGKPATQSSTYPGYVSAGAASAVDGNMDGTFSDGSVTATNLDANAWWQVDLSASAAIGSIVIWNRTDCCASRLNDYWVFVSDTPFGANDTPFTLQNRAGTWSSHQTTAPNPSTTIAAGAEGRYVRVQLSDPNYLSLAEVQVLR